MSGGNSSGESDGSTPKIRGKGRKASKRAEYQSAYGDYGTLVLGLCIRLGAVGASQIEFPILPCDSVDAGKTSNDSSARSNEANCTNLLAAFSNWSRVPV